jgi:hypothetical protein
MAGYSPASNKIVNLPQAQVTFYDKTFVDNLKANTFFLRCSTRRMLPMNSGSQLELFMYQTLGPNTAQAAEGTVGTGITITVVDNVTTIGQYADYLNFSDLVMATAIDPALENSQKELAYRFAVSLSTIAMRTADSAALIDSNVLRQKAIGTTFGRSDINTAVASMLGRNIKPYQDARMVGVVHPFLIGDALNSTTYGDPTDLLKRTAEGQEKLSELPTGDGGDNVPVLDWAGVSFFASTLVTQTPNYLGNSGTTALRTYIFGKDGLITISLGEGDGTNPGDGDWRNLDIWINRYTEPSVSDPARMIGGSTAYNTKWACTLPPDTTQRIRLIDTVNVVS